MKKQLLRFLIVGFSTVLIDYLIYKLFLHFNAAPSIAKTVSFLSGSIYAYFLNKYYTFEKQNQGAQDFFKFIVLYGLGLALNVSINSLTLNMLGDFSLDIFEFRLTSFNIAFLLATSTSTFTNFMGQKFWVFR